MCCCIGHWLAAYIGPQHWHVQPSYLLPKEQLGSALLGAQWTDKWSKAGCVQGPQLLLVPHVDFSFQALPSFWPR